MPLTKKTDRCYTCTISMISCPEMTVYLAGNSNSSVVINGAIQWNQKFYRPPKPWLSFRAITIALLKASQSSSYPVGKRSCKSHVLAVANLADALCKKVTVGCFSKFRGETLSVPEKKTRTSLMLQPVFSSAKVGSQIITYLCIHDIACMWWGSIEMYSSKLHTSTLIQEVSEVHPCLLLQGIERRALLTIFYHHQVFKCL